MKKSIFYITTVILLSTSILSCTTDGYDKDMEQSVIHNDDTTTDSTDSTDSTDPIVIPKRD